MLTAEKEIDSNAVSSSEFTYSDSGYLAQTEQKIGNGSEYIIEYERDQGGLTSQVMYPDTNMNGMVLDIAYTPLGKIASIEQDNDTLVQYTYLGQNVLERFYPDPCVTLTASFDDFGRTERLYSRTDTTNIVDFLYSYDDNGNITNQKFAHRTSDPCNLYAYDNLDRLTEADYLVGVLTEDEQFTYDKLGNRTTVNLRNGNDETYARNDLTNRYDATGSYDITLDYDDAGNMTECNLDYTYEYDYENRLTSIEDYQQNLVAEYTYDALGRRIEKIAGGITTRYYYDGWRILSEVKGDTRRDFVYGNYLDEVLMMIVDDGQNQTDHYYAHDHLFSPVALIADDGTVEERYEYDAYGKCTIWDATFTNTRSISFYNNPYYYQGKPTDYLDNGNLPLAKWPYRDYLYGLGRWNQAEKLGMIPNDSAINPYGPVKQYEDGINLYEAFKSNPAIHYDVYGLLCGCGPDITLQLMKLNLRIDQDWTLSSYAERFARCAASSTPWGWDILELWHESISHNRCPESKGCLNTVTVSGKCYRQGAVNYWLWGKIHRLCDELSIGDTEGRAIGYAIAWKGTAYGHGIGRETEGWIRAGYHVRFGGVFSTHYICKPCVEKYKHKLHYVFGWGDRDHF